MKVLRYIVAGVVALLVLGTIVLYGVSEIMLRRTWDAPLREFAARTDSASVAEGERLARIRGCTGCHGQNLEGESFIDEALVATLWAPNLTRAARDQTDAELERVIRRGVLLSGRSVLVMPSDMFDELADEDLAQIMGFIRSLPVVDRPSPRLRVGPLGRVGVIMGQVTPIAGAIDGKPGARVPRDVETEWGRYLARTVCTECHGAKLQGDPSGKPPNLKMAAAYAEADWFRLMREGRGIGDRDLGLMSEVAKGRFSYMTDEELRALRAYLLTLSP